MPLRHNHSGYSAGIIVVFFPMQIVYFLLTIVTNLIWNCGREVTRGDFLYSVECMQPSWSLSRPLQSPPGWTNRLLTRALDPVLRRPQRLYTFLPLCHLIQPFQKALKLFTLPPPAGQQGNKGAVSPNDVGRLV